MFGAYIKFKTMNQVNATLVITQQKGGMGVVTIQQAKKSIKSQRKIIKIEFFKKIHLKSWQSWQFIVFSFI
jgi:hypothetical protein